MSTTASTWAFAQKTGSTTAKFVLIALADCMNERTGQCNPSIKCLVEKTELSERTVHNQLAFLEKANLIEIVRVFSENGKPRPNHYKLKIGASDDSIGASAAPIEAGIGASDDSIGASAAPPLEPEKNQKIFTTTTTPKPPLETNVSEDMPTEGATTGTPELDQTHTRQPIPTDWQPSDRCVELCVRAGLTANEVMTLVDEFVLYWAARGDKRHGWESTFLNHAKRQAAHMRGKQAQKNRSTDSAPNGSASVYTPPKRESNYGKPKPRSPVRKLQASCEFAERYAVETCSADT